MVKYLTWKESCLEVKHLGRFQTLRNNSQQHVMQQGVQTEETLNT